MTMLTATAVITAVDRASPVFGRVAAAARAASGRYAAAANSFAAAGSRMHGAMGLTLAMPTALAVSSFGHDQYQWDKAIHQYQAIAELAPDTMEAVKASITNVSNELGINKLELLAAAKGWQELGNSPESFIKNVQVAARASRITGIEIGEQMKESSALMRAWGHQMSDTGMYKHYEEVYLVASKGMKGGAHAFGEAMQSFAPIAAGLGISFEEASAFVQTLGGQFEPSAIGNALKTGFLRLAAPVPKAEAMLRSQGIDRGKLFRYDNKKVRDGHALAEMLRGTGSFTVGKDIEAVIRRDLEQADLSKGMAPVVDKLNADLAKSFHLGGGDSMNRKILGAAILQHMSAAATGLDPKEFFRVFGPLSKNLAFMSAVFGKEHAAKFMDLLKQMEHYEENLKHIEDTAPGALERKSGIFFEGFHFEWDRLTASVDNFLNSIGASGIRGDMAGLFQSISAMFRSAQEADPESLQALFWGITGLAALAPAGYVLSGITTSLKMIASLEFAGLVAAGVAAYELYENWGKLKELAADPLKFDVIFPDAPDWLKSLNKGAWTVEDRDKYPYLFSQGNPDWWNRLNFGEGATSKYYKAPDSGLAPLSPILQDRMDFGQGLRLMRDIDPNAGPARIDVNGTVGGKMELEATIKVEGGGQVVNQRTTGGEIKGKLNTGTTMPDTGVQK